MRQLRPMRFGVVLAIVTILFGYGLGGAFGANEEGLKAGLEGDARAALATAYGGDEAKLAKVTSKSWAYLKRAHLHAGALGTGALALCLLLGFCGRTDERLRLGVSVGLGVGGLGYGLFWLLAGFRAPGLGSTGAAKESLQWLAVPSAGLCLLGVAACLAIFVREAFVLPAEDASAD